MKGYSRLRLMKVSFDTTYLHVLDFNSKSEQSEYFSNLESLSFNDLSFLRLDNIKVPCNIDVLDTYGYAMVVNNGRIYYCFITSKEYLNENTTLLSLKVDVWQTFMFDYTINASFVEREHVANDSIGANTIDENIELGEYIKKDLKVDNFKLGADTYLLVCKYDIAGKVSGGILINGVPVAGSCYAFSDISDLMSTIKVVTSEHADAIVGCSLVPRKSIQGFVDGDSVSPSYMYFNMFNIGVSNTLDGYVPRNNKLLTYPYRMINVDNCNGNSRDYVIEHFNSPNGGIMFYLSITGGLIPQALTMPMYYKGSQYGVSYDLKITYNNPIPFNVSTFNSWLQNSSISSVIAGVGAFATGNPVAGAFGLANIANEFYQHERNSASTFNGNVGISYLTNGAKFVAYEKTITSNYARMIDDYFTRFGYKVNALKVPATKTRSNFNYVKTQNISLKGGSIDGKYLTELETIYNNGVTIWHSISNFRNYNVLNEVI